ncbi:MAG: hypothetical protein P5702_07715 [Limnospira sp. PMC 1291.21]|uniref:Uncharacterized protein n=1 Tax=Limnospira fusiformis PMC 851.14 TaxID=2219512 RepID=A0ABU9EH76_LIMFS|nr:MULTISPECIES: hypothetical protein [Limnospira]EKD11689.1 hypothetical protein SPLC1_S010860 [Arthrospira platensis C1]MBD2670676.1 hypothetical protein [Arthrospira platensis FACHB-439]MDC0840564.1 hypothetical protein [Limnoraphis robusta]MDT9188433.1 hypothetical protein [Limnospira sp. PMC 894.15]MDT9284583.1 hypothetical protein [Limnospira sp. PMC 1298.21]MDT9314609.1 hypothetical protein [Limnospira sp. PMC 1306.21]MDY7053777.1 hypothetical protein [Limnospira fusiformis LS22]
MIANFPWTGNTTWELGFATTSNAIATSTVFNRYRQQRGKVSWQGV